MKTKITTGMQHAAITILTIVALLLINTLINKVDDVREDKICRELLTMSKTHQESLTVYVSKQAPRTTPIFSDDHNCYDVLHKK